MGLGKCFGSFCDGCIPVTQHYEMGAGTESKFVCTKVDQSWLEQARAEMEYKRNKRLCPHCGLELPMLPRPMYMQQYFDNLWKVENPSSTKDRRPVSTISDYSSSIRIVPNFERRKTPVVFYKK